MTLKNLTTVIHHAPNNYTTMTEDRYREAYHQSITDPVSFWDEQAKQHISWFQSWDAVVQGDFVHQKPNWFVHGKLNACYNCVDRHLDTRAHQTALIFEGNQEHDTQHYTYQELHEQICLCANLLKAHGVKKGDRVILYLPMIAELAIAMLACARIGAIHCVVFSGFSAEALKSRLLDTQGSVVITADEAVRGDKIIPLKHTVDLALLDCPFVHTVIVIKKTGCPIPWHEHRDHWYHERLTEVSAECPVTCMDAADPLFILYTSGSTGKPKGIVHTTGAYLVYVALSYKVIFNHQEGDTLFCTADLGWITGHSYLVYGPLANGGTTILYEGIPSFPTYARYWEIIDKHRVTQFYTSPTALRLLRHEGNEWVDSTQRDSLRVLGSVGEPISPDLWLWYYQMVGKQRCPIVNTWWQTETGGILLSALPSATTFHPGSAGVPFFGVQAEIVDGQGHIQEGTALGRLVITHPWPGMMSTIYGDEQRFMNQYLNVIPGYYLTGDSAYRNAAGELIVAGRDDDVIKVSGHRLGSEELERALMSHHDVSEVAVVGGPHELKGECVLAFVTLKACVHPTDALKAALKQHLRDNIGPIATPEHIYWVRELPKTRSGKIMRRILRKISHQDYADLGDVSTLINPSVVAQLITDLQN